MHFERAHGGPKRNRTSNTALGKLSYIRLTMGPNVIFLNDSSYLTCPASPINLRALKSKKKNDKCEKKIQNMLVTNYLFQFKIEKKSKDVSLGRSIFIKTVLFICIMLFMAVIYLVFFEIIIIKYKEIN